MTEVRLQQRIAAPPERVYAAWLQPDLIRRWLAPEGYSVARVEVDARVGGRLSVWHRDGEDEAGSDVGGAEAVFVELEPGARIVLRWWFVGPDREADPESESRLVVTLDPVGDGETLLTLVHDRLDRLRAAHPEIGDNVAAGWTGTLQGLAARLA